jgi:hypothetical protein
VRALSEALDRMRVVHRRDPNPNPNPKPVRPPCTCAHSSDLTHLGSPPGICSGQRACQHAQLGILETGSQADSGIPPAALRQLHSLTRRVRG